MTFSGKGFFCFAARTSKISVLGSHYSNAGKLNWALVFRRSIDLPRLPFLIGLEGIVPDYTPTANSPDGGKTIVPFSGEEDGRPLDLRGEK